MPTTISVPGSLGAREALVANRSYYVATTGNDSNPGTVGSPYLTIGKAILKVGTLDLAGQYTVTINVADGTYVERLTLPEVLGNFTAGFGLGGSVSIVGNTTTPGNVIVGNQSAGATATVSVVGNGWLINGMKLVTGSGGTCVYASGPHVFAFGTKLEFTSHAGAQTGISVNQGAALAAPNLTAAIHGANWGNFINNNGGHIFMVIVGTVNNSPAWGADGFITSQACGESVVAGAITGTATGKRYSAVTNSVINTNGGGASFFPGDSAGSTATGGQYV